MGAEQLAQSEGAELAAWESWHPRGLLARCGLGLRYNVVVAKRPAAKKPEDAPPARAAVAAPTELGPACRVVLFIGPEGFLRNAYTDQLKSMLAKEHGDQPEVFRFDGAAPGIQVVDVLDECRSFGLMAQHKLVIVDNAETLLKESGEGDDGEPAPAADDDGPGRGPKKMSKRELMERYVQAPSENATLVLRSEKGWRPGKIDKYIAQVGMVKECKPPEPAKALVWMVARTRNAYQRTLEPAAAEALLELLGVDLARFDGELAKMSSSVKADEPITEELVRSMVQGTSQEEKPYILGDYLLNPNPAVPLGKIRELVDLAGMDEVPLRWTCLGTASKLHAVCREIAAGVPANVAGRSIKGMWGGQAEMIRAAGKKIRPRDAAALLRHCVDADVRAKSGGGDIRLGLEILGLRFSGAARGEGEWLRG